MAVVTVLHPRTEVSASRPIEQLRGRAELEVTLRVAAGRPGYRGRRPLDKTDGCVRAVFRP